MWLEFDFVLVLDDATGLNFRQRERLSQDFFAASLFDYFLERLALEIDEGAVRADGPSAKIPDLARLLAEGNLHVSVLHAFLGEDLGAEVLGDRLPVGVDI